MLTAILLGLALGVQPADCAVKPDAAPSTLIVQVVDELWLPLPGALVIARQGRHSAEAARGTADASGFVRLSITKQGVYDVEASLTGFKNQRVGKVDVDADPSQVASLRTAEAYGRQPEGRHHGHVRAGNAEAHRS